MQATQYENVAVDIATCPECNIQLIKGDGCNSITCICGWYVLHILLYHYYTNTYIPAALLVLIIAVIALYTRCTLSVL
jgi:hypothetical protein